MDQATVRRLGAEFLGTFVLVLGCCGSAVLAAAFPEVGIGLLGVSLAFGLSVVTMAYAIGHISGCHLNPAVTVGRMFSDTFAGIAPSSAPGFIAAQIVGGLLGLALIAALYPDAAATANDVVIPHQTDAHHADQRSST